MTLRERLKGVTGPETLLIQLHINDGYTPWSYALLDAMLKQNDVDYELLDDRLHIRQTFVDGDRIYPTIAVYFGCYQIYDSLIDNLQTYEYVLNTRQSELKTQIQNIEQQLSLQNEIEEEME